MNATLELPEALIDELAERLQERVGKTPRYVSKEKLADRLGITERTIKTWRSHGLPAVKVGRELMFDVDDVDRWIEAHA